MTKTTAVEGIWVLMEADKDTGFVSSEVQGWLEWPVLLWSPCHSQIRVQPQLWAMCRSVRGPSNCMASNMMGVP